MSKKRVSKKRTGTKKPERSWVITLILAPIMLLIGFGAGYLLRPTIGEQSPVASEGTERPAPTAQAAARDTVDTAAVTSQVRHFLGDPGAPVTMIEFGDFQ